MSVLRYCWFAVFFLLHVAAIAQPLHGLVTDAATGRPLAAVTIVNQDNKQTAYSDAQGHYRIDTRPGDHLKISYIGYTTAQLLAPPVSAAVFNTPLSPQSINLSEYTIHSGMTRYQRDSAAMRSMYGKELDKKPVTPTVGFNNGIVISGLIGALASKITGGDKQIKHFKKQYKNWEEQKYVDTRYTPELVTSLTGFTRDTLGRFMDAYPMPYDFARAASDLEIKMWIRYNYREYINKRKDNPEAVVEKAH